MEAVTSSSPPAGAPTLAVVVWIRPDVHALPDFRAVMPRSPLPSRWTLLDELVMVSISPVPKLEPGPVSYIQLDDGPAPDAPLKSSLKMVDQPEGGPGTAAGAASARLAAGAAAAPGAAGWAGAARAAGATTPAGARMATATAAPRASRRRRVNDRGRAESAGRDDGSGERV